MQEFNNDVGGSVDLEYFELKRKEAEHWWYSNGWERSSIAAFYRFEGLPERKASLGSDISES